MDNCFEEKTYLFYLDSELPISAREAVEKHLRRCPKCRTNIEKEMTLNREIAASFDSGRRPEDLFHRIETETGPVKKPVKFKLKWPLGIAAAILVIVIANSLFLKKTVLFEREQQNEDQLLISSARIEGKTAKPYLLIASDGDKKYIWIEKIK